MQHDYPASAELDRESPERRSELTPWTSAGVELEQLCLVAPVVEALRRGQLEEGTAKELLGLTAFDELPEAAIGDREAAAGAGAVRLGQEGTSGRGGE